MNVSVFATHSQIGIETISINDCIAILTRIKSAIIWINDDVGEATTVSEGLVSDAGHAIGDGDTGQTTTVSKSSMSNGGYAIWKVYALKATTIYKSIVVDSFHTIGDDNGSQVDTIPEGLVSDACKSLKVFELIETGNLMVILERVP